MELIIKNYKNIKEMDYKIIDKKINFLFGMSGTGKSSIPNAIFDKNLEDNQKFGTTDKPEILIDGKLPNENEFSVFNEKNVENYFKSDIDENETFYSIIIDDENKYINAQKKFNDALSDLDIAMAMNYDKYNEISAFLKSIGALNLKNDGTLKATSQLNKVINTIDKDLNKKIYKEINLMKDGKFEWILAGTSFIENNECPFCSKKINKRLNNKLIKYKNYDSKSIKVIKEGIPSYEKYTKEKIKYTSNSLHLMANNAIQMSKACKEYNEIQSYIEEMKKFDIVTGKIKEITINEEFYDFFPDLKNVIKTINNNIISLNKKYEAAKRKTADILRRKLSNINKIIARFGIPYKMSVKYNQGKVNDYKLIHNDDKKNNNSKLKLSTGEKNIISLIFFILTAEKSNYKTIIIDDPVSSYDVCRRSIIFKLIMERLKEKTVLVLSHDNVFSKYASIEKSKRIGNIYFFQNHDDNIEFIPICKSDFGLFNEFVIEKIKSCKNYYQKIINLRMLYEGKHNSKPYQYLSALLHAESIDNIKKLLKDRESDENEIIKAIKDDYKIELEPMHEDYYKNIDTNEFSLFEKALFLREYLSEHNNIDKNIKGELSDFIHLNDRLHITLNPYKFFLCTQNTYDIINDKIKGILNVKEE